MIAFWEGSRYESGFSSQFLHHCVHGDCDRRRLYCRPKAIYMFSFTHTRKTMTSITITVTIIIHVILVPLLSLCLAVLESVSLEKIIPESPQSSEAGDLSPCRSPSTPRHLRYRQPGGMTISLSFCKRFNITFKMQIFSDFFTTA